MATVNFHKEGKIGILAINRPESLNALNTQVLVDLQKIFLQLMSDQDPIRALIVTGTGEKSFVAGADIKEMEAMNGDQARDFAEQGQTLFYQLEKFAFPTIAAVNGFALGGGLELALACDWIVASTKTKWGLPEVSLGLIPGYGGTQRLSRVVGKSLAKRIALTGEMFTAEQGLDWGVFTQLAEPTEVLTVAKKQAEMILTRAPVAVHLAKQAIEIGFDESLKDGLKAEAMAFGHAFETKDHNEGIQAFIAKRPPQFKGE